MSTVFVLTDKGWQDQDAVTTDHSVYCYDIQTGNMDLCNVTSVKDVSKYQTYYFYNRNINYGTYCNGAGNVALYNAYQGLPYSASVNDVIERFDEYDIPFPCHLKGMSANIRTNYFDTSKYGRFEKDIKLRRIGLFHFELDVAAVLTFLDQWKNRYQRLNAVDYNQAMMIQMVLLKGGYLSRIKQEIGFNVNPIERDSAIITNVDVSKSVHITQLYYNEDKQLHPICQIKDDVVIC